MTKSPNNIHAVRRWNRSDRMRATPIMVWAAVISVFLDLARVEGQGDPATADQVGQRQRTHQQCPLVDLR